MFFSKSHPHVGRKGTHSMHSWSKKISGEPLCARTPDLLLSYCVILMMYYMLFCTFILKKKLKKMLQGFHSCIFVHLKVHRKAHFVGRLESEPFVENKISIFQEDKEPLWCYVCCYFKVHSLKRMWKLNFANTQTCMDFLTGCVSSHTRSCTMLLRNCKVSRETSWPHLSLLLDALNRWLQV